MEMEIARIGHPSVHRKNATATLQLITSTVIRYWYWFVLSLGAFISYAYFVNRNTNPEYLVRTSLLVKETKSAAKNPQLLLYGEGQETESPKASIPEEIALLESYQFIRRTLDSMNMVVSYFSKGDFQTRELYGSLPFVVAFPDTGALKLLYGKRIQVRFNSTSEFVISDLSKIAGDRKELTGHRGEILKIAACPMVIETTPFFKKADVGKMFEVEVNEPEALAWDFRSRLNIQTNGPDASIIRIYLATSAPQKGIDFLNEFTRQYLNYKYEEKIRAVAQSLAFIDSQLGLISDSLGSTEANLEQFKSANAFTDPGKMTDWSMAALSDLDRNRLSLVITDRYYKSLLSNLTQSQDAGKMVPPASAGINDQATGDMINELATLQAEKERYAAMGITRNPLAIEVDEKINTVRNALKGKVNGIIQDNAARLKLADQSSGKQQHIINKLPRAERKFVDIKRENVLNEQIYLFLSQKKLEAGIMKAATTVESKVIEHALLDSAVPLRPKKRNNYALAVLAGIAVPSVLIYLAGVFNRKVTKLDDVKAMLSMPYFGTVFVNQDKKSGGMASDARTAFSESIRILRSQIIARGKASENVLLVSSMERGEGKSFCSINMATALALVKKKVVLVNLDLRAQQSFFPALENSLGAGAYLDDLIPLQEIITETDTPFLDYIPAGQCPQHAAELFRDEKIEEMITYLKERYDYIIIDCSPVGKIADSMVIARFADIGLYIIRANYSRKSDLSLLNHFYEEGRLGQAGFIWNAQRLNRKDRNNFYYRKQKGPSEKKALLLRNLP